MSHTCEPAGDYTSVPIGRPIANTQIYLFDQYHQQLAHFVFSVTRSRELTEEIIQDVFVKIWEERRSLPELKSFSAYLFIGALLADRVPVDHSYQVLASVARMVV